MDQQPQSQNTLTKTKTRTSIDPITKCNLIKTVIQDHLPIYQAAIIHKVKYSTAKHILRNYNNDGIENFTCQRRRRRKIICKFISLIVDLNSGQIDLQFKETIQTPNNTLTVNNQLLDESINQISKSIYCQIYRQDSVKVKQEDYTSKLNESLNLEQKIEFLYKTISEQQKEMEMVLGK